MATDKPNSGDAVESQSPPAESEKYQQPPQRGPKEWLFIGLLCSTQFFVQGAFGYILLPLRIVAETFHQAPEQAAKMSWHVAGYSLTVGTFILIAGKLGDIYGSKNILVLGWVWFGVWSIIGGCSAFTESAIFFDTARAMQGIGPAFLIPNALAIAGRTYPPGRKKNIIFALFAMAAPLGCVTAGAIGAAVAQYIWWPWVMWIYAAGCIIAAITAFFVVPKDMVRIEDKKPTFDWLGSMLGVAGLLLLNTSWQQATVDGWTTPYVYVLLILGFVFLALFFLQEKTVQEPLVDISIFNKHVAVVLITTGLGWSSFGIWFYYMFQFIQNFRHVSPLDSAAQFAPGAISGILAAMVCPYMMTNVANGWLMAIANAAFFVGCTLQATAPVHQSYWFNSFWSFVIMAWGMDISFPASSMILSDAVAMKYQGVSASLVNSVVNYSTAIGLGIAGTVEGLASHDGTHVLRGYRAAMYTSVVLSGLGLAIAVTYASCISITKRRSNKQ